jgi:AraC-like DNA-binding protein
MSTQLPVDDAFLGGLLAEWPETAAAHVPLVLVYDIVERPWWRRLRHRDFQSLYITERGRGLHVIDSTPYGVSRGDVYVMGAGSDHTFGEGHRLLLHAIHFSPEIFDAETWGALAGVPGFESLLVDPAMGRRLHLDPAAYADVARDLAELWAEWRNGTPAGALLVRAMLLRLLVRLARLAAGDKPPLLERPTGTARHEEVVATAVRTIDLHYAKPLRVDQLAASAYLSPDRFTEIFAAVMGRTPRDYIRHVRLERAKTLLATSAMPISDVARATGFRENPYFTRAFRAATGISPREFRRAAQSRPT